MLPHLRPLPYDAQRDFAPIARLATAPNVLVVSPALKVATVAEFLQAARARSGTLNYSSSGNGSVTHLIGADFAQQMNAMFEADLGAAVPVTLEAWEKRSPLLRAREALARLWEYWL